MDTKRTFLGSLIGIFPCAAFSLGIGEMELSSYLHTPLEAKIPIFSADDVPKEAIRVGLADAESFQRAGLERFHHLNKLMFEVKEAEKGQFYIDLKSKPPIREPFLSFLLEISWPTGSLVKEYTVLLDPPVLLAPATLEAPQATISSLSNATAESSAATNDLNFSTPDSIEIIPVQSADTLWAIAMRYRPQGASVLSTMKAIHEQNPNAFIANNMNLLKAGSQLEIPVFEPGLVDPSNTQVNPQKLAATSEGNPQFSAKKEIGTIDFAQLDTPGAMSDAAVGVFEPQLQEQTSEPSLATVETTETPNEAEQGGLLKLVVGNKEVGDSSVLFEEDDQAGSEFSVVPSEISEKLALTEESLDTLIRENIELRQQVATLREQAMNFDNGIELANAELKALQAAQTKEIHEIRKRIRESLEANQGGNSILWLSILLGLFSFTTALLMVLWYREKSIRNAAIQDVQKNTVTTTDESTANESTQPLVNSSQKVMSISEEDLVEFESLDDVNDDLSEEALNVSEEALISLLSKDPANENAHIKLLKLYLKSDNEIAFLRHRDSLPSELLTNEAFIAKVKVLDPDNASLTNDGPVDTSDDTQEQFKPILKSDALTQAVIELKEKDTVSESVPVMPHESEQIPEQELSAQGTIASGLRLEPIESKENTPKTAKESAVFRVEEDSDLAAEDKNATKLDLARAFIEMNSIYNARLMLQQVIEEGTNDQANQAKELLKRT